MMPHLGMSFQKLKLLVLAFALIFLIGIAHACEQADRQPFFESLDSRRQAVFLTEVR